MSISTLRHVRDTILPLAPSDKLVYGAMKFLGFDRNIKLVELSIRHFINQHDGGETIKDLCDDIADSVMGEIYSS